MGRTQRCQRICTHHFAIQNRNADLKAWKARLFPLISSFVVFMHSAVADICVFFEAASRWFCVVHF